MGPRRRSCPTTSSTRRMWSTCWVNWWTSPSSSSTTRTAGCATGCSRPSASTRGSASTRVATRSRCDVATPTTTSRWPKRPVRTCGAESTSSGPASSTRDIDNFRAALDWAVETPSPEHALRLVAAVGGARQDRRTRDGLGRDRDRDPRRRRSPARSRGRRLGRVGRHDGSAISSGPKTSSPSRNEPKRRSVHGFRPWRGLRRSSRSIAMTSRRHDVTPRNGSSSREQSGDAYELAHALLMLGGALQITEPTLDAAIAATDEAVRVARAAGIDGALAIALPNARDVAPARGVRTRARPARRSHRDRHPDR